MVQQMQLSNTFLVVITSTALHWPMLAMASGNEKTVCLLYIPFC